MTINLESREHCEGVLHLQANRDTVIAFTGRAYLENLDYLTAASAQFVQRNFCWPMELAQMSMTRALKVTRLTGGRELDAGIISMITEDPRKAREIPSVMFFRRENTPPGRYGGISVQRMFFVPTEEMGEVPILYHSLRAMERDYRRQKRAELSVQLALFLHKEARKYIHRSTNPIAVYANLRSPVLSQEGRHPIDTPFDQIPVDYEIAKAVFNIIRINGEELEPSGVSRRDFPMRNRGFVLAEIENTSVMAAYRGMVLSRAEGGWDMFMDIGKEEEGLEGQDTGHFMYNVGVQGR